MDLLRDLDTVPASLTGGVLTVGVFDGVHVGHQAVLGRAVERARELGAAAVVYTFHPHPLEVLEPDRAPPLIQTFGQKLEMMRAMGVAAAVWPRDLARVLATPPEAFIREVAGDALAVRAMVEGAGFRFGAGGAGDPALLCDLGAAIAFEVEFVEHVEVDGERVSSTRIRDLVADGRMDEAARCLGRPYSYVGTVVEGHHRGGRLGYPTVNVSAPRFLTPAEGVYAGWTEVRGRRYAAAVSVGRAPTFGQDEPVTVEAYLLDFDGELYGEQVTVEFVTYLRPQEAFADAEALKAQMADDCRRVREAVAGHI
ncbi:MAG: bifunctional riboflavin kinase/FAD synthetase [Phycisphaerae bacterium]